MTPLTRRAILAAAASAGAFGAVSTLTGCSTGSPQAGTSGGTSTGAAPGSGTATGTPSATPSTSTPGSPSASASGSPSGSATAPTPDGKPATAAQIMARANVPVLCYHQVRNWTGQDSGYTKKFLVIPPARLRAQLDAIQAAGYTAITPDQHLAHLTTGAPLPDKPFLLTFDDGKDNQPEVAFPEVKKRGMAATFFVMTVVLDQPGWMKKKQVAAMAKAGMTIGCHSWDHHPASKYHGKDYTTQIVEPTKLLREISGQPVDTWAYPYGAWNPDNFSHIEGVGLKTAYQLSDRPMDAKQPLMTLRRTLAESTWSPAEVVSVLDRLSAGKKV